jgi:hypothetical protein
MSVEQNVTEMEDRENLNKGKFGVDQGSIMDQLRKTHAEMVDNETVDLDIPNYKGQLVARYRVLSNEELEKIAKRIRRAFKGQRDRQADMVLALAEDGLIASCTGLYFRDDEGELQQLMADGFPIVYDHNLAEFLNVEAANARDTVLAVFGGSHRDMSVVDHYMRIIRWMRDSGADVTGELMGEF